MKSKLLQMVQDEVQAINADELRMPKEMFRVISINLEILTSCYIIKKWGKLDVERFCVEIDDGIRSGAARLRVVHTQSRRGLFCDQACIMRYSRFRDGSHAGWDLYLSTEVVYPDRHTQFPQNTLEATWHNVFDRSSSVTLRDMRSILSKTRDFHLNCTLSPFLNS